MPDRNATDFLNLRLPLYAYTAPLWHGRRVLEIGCGDGGAADYLGGAGAASVLSVDVDGARVERARARHTRARVDFRAVDAGALDALGERFDVILIPDGASLLSTVGLIPALRGLLSEGGHLIVAVPAADRRNRPDRDGVGYYDLVDPLAAVFPAVRMLGQTPFLGFGLVEFDGTPDALRVDVSLLQGGSEPPSHYVAVAGMTAPPALGYALVQVPFGPVEALLAGAGAPLPAVTLAPSHLAELAAAETRVQMAERRLEEAERRGRTRVDEAENRVSDLRRKLDDALVKSESAVRVSRAQGEEIEELRARLRRMVEDRETTDADMGKLRRALTQADESVLTLTRRTAEEMAVVAERLVSGLGSVVAAPAATGVAASSAEVEARVRRAEEAAARDRAELGTLTQRLREADEQIQSLKQKAAALAERDDRIARLEGDKQDLLWRVAELEEKLRHAEADGAGRQAVPDEVAAVRAARDRAIEQFHRGAAAHANEVHQLQSSVTEQAALVAELEDDLRAAEARAAAADKEATTLRRNAKELEEADRARRGRLAELEGKLLRLERERAIAASAAAEPAAANGAVAAEDSAAAARASAAEQRALLAEQRAAALQEQIAALRLAAEDTPAPTTATAPAAPVPPPRGNGHAAVPEDDIQEAVAELEARLRDEMSTLAAIEDSLARARDEATRGAHGVDPNVRADLERALAAKDSQLIEGRLELARLRRDSEARQAQLEREISDLRARLDPSGASSLSDEHSQGAQLILMHSTLANIRRRSARLRDELEGFRRRLDTLPPGALSSILEEIGEDLAEFAK